MNDKGVCTIQKNQIIQIKLLYHQSSYGISHHICCLETVQHY
jgi:hypothetical protein